MHFLLRDRQDWGFVLFPGVGVRLVGGDFGCEGVGELGQFFFAPAGDGGHGLACGGEVYGHLAERGVAQDDVGGDAAFIGEAFAEFAEAIEECLIAFDDAGGCGCAGCDG